MPLSPPALRELDTITCRWQWALDAASRALDADCHELPEAEIASERRALVHERAEIAELLARAAATRAIEPTPWLPAGPVDLRVLGLPATTQACLFDLDGVLTDSGALHAAAWAGALDPFLLAQAHDSHRQFIPFDAEVEYALYFDGRPRLEGLALFLAGRGLRVDEEAGRRIAERKGELLEHGLMRRGVASQPGGRQYLQAAGYARLGRAVVSASLTAAPMLQLADLTQLVEVQVDAGTIRARGLRSRPAPDLLLAACEELDVRPEQAATLTHSGAGVVAGLAAGLTVVGVARGTQAEQLRAYGAPRVVPTLAALLDPRLRSAA